jgi:hypothetical protein
MVRETAGTQLELVPCTHFLSAAVATSFRRVERLDAILNARESFAHMNTAQHNEEIAAGADAALAKHLTFLLYWRVRANNSWSDEEDLHNLESELGMTCEALDSLFQASPEAVGASFRRLGQHLLSVLVQLLQEELKSRTSVLDAIAGGSVSSNSASPTGPSPGSELFEEGTSEGDVLLRKITRVLGHFARVGEATEPMAHFPGLLQSLLVLVAAKPYEHIPWESRLSALWIIANLGCCPNNMQMMAQTPGLVPALIQVASRPIHQVSESLETTIETLRSRAIVARCFLNLSWSPENKILFAEQAPLLDLLASLLVQRTLTSTSPLTDGFSYGTSPQAHPLSRSRTVKSVLISMRQYAAGSIRNIAAAPRRYKVLLCEHRSGYLLDALTDAALNDTDQSVKDRAFAAIHNLANHDSK